MFCDYLNTVSRKVCTLVLRNAVRFVAVALTMQMLNLGQHIVPYFFSCHKLTALYRHQIKMRVNIASTNTPSYHRKRYISVINNE